MKTPAQKVIYSLLTLILLLSIGSGVVATNGNRTELINPELGFCKLIVFQQESCRTDSVSIHHKTKRR